MITESVGACAECVDGKMAVNDVETGVKKGEECPFCNTERDFLARCDKLLGPIVIDSAETMRAALNDPDAFVMELPSSAPETAIERAARALRSDSAVASTTVHGIIEEGCFSAALGKPSK